MSGVKVGGVWKTPAVVYVKVAGVWRTAATVSTKVAGTWRTTTLAGPPPVPTLSYTAERTYTITNYDANLTYTVTGATRSGNTITGATNGATITSAYAPGATQSAARTMNLLAHSRVLTTIYSGLGSAGCSPRPDYYCQGGSILDTSGNTYLPGPGTFHPNNPGPCDWQCNDCWLLFGTCYNWYWTNYSGNGYTLFGSWWGKST